jgi:hypothetical protein
MLKDYVDVPSGRSSCLGAGSSWSSWSIDAHDPD